jgi:ankyrin repeat protein
VKEVALTKADAQLKPSGPAVKTKPSQAADAYGFTKEDRKRRVYGSTVIGGLTALLIAARDGQTDAVRELLEGGTDINQTSETDHATALILAIINGHYDLAKFLLTKSADPKLVTTDGVGPLYAALDVQWSPHTWYPQPITTQEQTPYLDLLNELITHKADVNARISKRVWFRVYANDETWVELAGATPFLRAALAGDLAAMRLLVDRGADPKLATQSEDTPLMVAAGLGWAAYWTSNAPYSRLDAVKFLLEHGNDLRAKDAKGYTALHGAAFRGDNEMVKYLIAQGADVRAKNKEGETVADLANGLFEHAVIHPDTVALLEGLGSENSHNCRSNQCLVPTKEDKPVVAAKADSSEQSQPNSSSKPETVAARKE